MGNTTHMTTAGWLFLGFAWTAVLALTVFCFAKLFTVKRRDKPDDEGKHE